MDISGETSPSKVTMDIVSDISLSMEEPDTVATGDVYVEPHAVAESQNPLEESIPIVPVNEDYCRAATEIGSEEPQSKDASVEMPNILQTLARQEGVTVEGVTGTVATGEVMAESHINLEVSLSIVVVDEDDRRASTEIGSEEPQSKDATEETPNIPQTLAGQEGITVEGETDTVATGEVMAQSHINLEESLSIVAVNEHERRASTEIGSEEPQSKDATEETPNIPQTLAGQVGVTVYGVTGTVATGEAMAVSHNNLEESLSIVAVIDDEPLVTPTRKRTLRKKRLVFVETPRPVETQPRTPLTRGASKAATPPQKRNTKKGRRSMAKEKTKPHHHVPLLEQFASKLFMDSMKPTYRTTKSGDLPVAAKNAIWREWKTMNTPTRNYWMTQAKISLEREDTDEEIDFDQFRVEKRQKRKEKSIQEYAGEEAEEEEAQRDFDQFRVEKRQKRKEKSIQEYAVEEAEEEEAQRDVDQSRVVKRQKRQVNSLEEHAGEEPEEEDSQGLKSSGPMNAYIRFRVERLKWYKEDLKVEAVTEDIKERINIQWRELPEEDKKRYITDAQQERVVRRQLKKEGLYVQAHKYKSKRKEKVEDHWEKIESGTLAESGVKRQRWQSFMSLDWLVRFYNSMTLEQKDWMEEIGLGGLKELKINRTSEWFNKFILESYDPSDNSVRAHGRTVYITDKTVGWLFGISSTGIVLEPENSSVDTTQVAKMLGLGRSYTNVAVIGNWLNHPDQVELTDEWKRKAVMFVLSCFGMPGTRNGVRTTLVQYVMDLEKLKLVNWAATWLKFLQDSQKKSKLKEQFRGGGCLFIPMLVYMEKFEPKLCGYPEACRNAELTPRLKLWDKGHFLQRLKFLKRNCFQVDLREEKEEVGKSERLDAFMKKAAMECGVDLTEVIQHVVDTRLKEIRRDCLRKRKKPEETTVVIEDDEEVEEAGEEESEEEIEEGVNEDEESEGEETEEKENEEKEINQGGENAEEVVGEEQKGEEYREVEAEEVEAGAENEKGETGNEHLQEVVNENSGFGEHVESRDDDGVSFTSPERPIPSVSGQGQVPSATKKADTPLINKTAAPSVNSPVNVTQVSVTPPFKNQPAHGSPKIVQTQPSKQPQPRKQPQPKQRTQPTKQPTSGPKRASSRIHALGEFDVILPEMPTVDDCFMHYFMTMEAAPRITKDVQIRAKFSKDYLVRFGDDAHISRDFAWQMGGVHYYGCQMIDAMVMALNRKTQNMHKDTKKIWYLGACYAVLDQMNMDSEIYPQFCGKWEEMDMIACPLNVTDTHYFLMVLSFTHRRVYILDSMERGTMYNTAQIKKKLGQIHTCLMNTFPLEYFSMDIDVSNWPIAWTHCDIPRQGNGYDCGPYVCFFMHHLRELVPVPKRRIKVDERYLRIWVANQIARSVYNTRKETLLQELNEFKAIEDNERSVAYEYRQIESVMDKYKNVYI